MAAACTGAALAHPQTGPAAWHLRSLPAPSASAQALLLQADGDAAPEWGVFEGFSLTVTDISSDYPPMVYSIPENVSLFDLRDTDRDGKPELALIRGGRLEYWRDAARVAWDAPDMAVDFPAVQALAFGAPRPYPLFVERRGEDFLSAPIGAEPPLWSLEGVRINPMAPQGLDSLTLQRFQVWRTATPPLSNGARTEFRISQTFEPSPTTPREDRPPAFRPGGTRRARDASAVPVEEWPAFALSDTARVAYALAPPDFRDTLIRIEPASARPDSEAPRPSSVRRFPGVLIAPEESAADFNGDGFGDLLLWRAPESGASMDSLVRAAQTGLWNVVLTVHLYEPDANRFAAHPIEWFHAAAPVARVLEGSVRGPFSYLAIEDIDENGRMDLITSGTGTEMAAWRFTGKREAGPWLHAKFDQPMDGVVLTAHVPAYRWLGIARAGDQFHLFALPQH